MKKLLFAAAVTCGSIGIGNSASADPPSCNWGELTSASIAGGFEQGPHASDPSGDGHGPGTADEPRAGLANVVERGDLAATCEFISSSLP